MPCRVPCQGTVPWPGGPGGAGGGDGGMGGGLHRYRALWHDCHSNISQTINASACRQDGIFSKTSGICSRLL